MTTANDGRRAEFVSVAERIGHDLCHRSVFAGGTRTWLVRPDYAQRLDSGERAPAGGSLYAGSAGIALFLSHLGQVVGSREFLNVAKEGAKHALDWADALPSTTFAFWSGMVGVLYAAVSTAENTGDEELLGRSSQLLNRLTAEWKGSYALDVIAGEAGAITGLLWLSDRPQFAAAESLAVRMGDHVLSMAARLPEGWAWGVMPAAKKPLTGYAHGASGFAHALVELAAVSGDQRYLYAALQATHYELAQFDERSGNWLDYRNVRVSEYLTRGDEAQLAMQLRAGIDLKWQDGQQMLAWCHGAPGIGYCRLRLDSLTGIDAMRRQAVTAALTTSARLDESEDNFTLCHGIGGNADFLLAAAQDSLVDAANVHTTFERGYRELHLAGRQWPSGAAGGTEDVTLMLGSAGVGFAYLRAAGAVSHSPLLPVAARAKRIDLGAAAGQDALTLHHQDRSRSYRTLSQFHALPVSVWHTIGEIVAEAPLALQSASIDRLSRDALTKNEREAIDYDRAEITLLSTRLDLLQDLLEDISAKFISIRTARFQRSNRLTWQDSPLNPSTLPKAIRVRRGYVADLIQLSPLPALLLQSMDAPVGFDELLGRLINVLPEEHADRADTLLEEQLQALLSAGLIAPSFDRTSPTSATAKHAKTGR